ncbi:MAG: hypothetical protein ACRC33_25475 [Gemmataceae bacterium]
MGYVRVLAASVLAAAAGCGGGSTASVSGVVTLNGKPLEGASVSFTPMSADPNAVGGSYGKTDARGRYQFKTVAGNANGAAFGKHRVAISLYKENEQNPDGAGGTTSLPVKYNAESDLTFDVPSGGTEKADFALAP